MADPFFRRVLAGLALGILTGLFLGEAVWPIRIASDAFIKLLQVTVLPYVLGSVIVGIGDRSTDDAKLLARRGGLLLLLVWAAVLLWVVASSLAYPALGSRGMFAGDVPPAAPINWVDLYVPPTCSTRWPTTSFPQSCCSRSWPVSPSAACRPS